MLWLEKQVVRSLVAGQPAELRAGVEQYVDESLRAMPELLRAGVAAESVALGALTRASVLVGSGRRDAVARRLEKCRTSRISVIRQYERLLGSLVAFASLELDVTPAETREPLPALA